MKKRLSKRHQMPGLSILHEDRDLIVVDKAPGLLTIAADDERERTAYRLLTDYVRKGCVRSRERVFIVHRLDRETSGVLVFARTEAAKRDLQGNWEQTRKHYLAVVHGTPASEHGTINSYLAENSALRVYSTRDTTKGKPATTVWKRLQTNGDFSLLEIELLTGRKHQIRVHLADLGHAVAGDRKYGPPDSPSKIMALHAFRLELTHPFTGARMVFEAPVPHLFTRLMGVPVALPPSPSATLIVNKPAGKGCDHGNVPDSGRGPSTRQPD